MLSGTLVVVTAPVYFEVETGGWSDISWALSGPDHSCALLKQYWGEHDVLSVLEVGDL